MPKKARVGHNGVRRSKPKAQKRFELVRPERPSPGEGQQKRQVQEEEPFELANANASIVMVARGESDEDQLTARKDSASARRAPRRATQKARPRNASAMITAEDFMYVKRDLATIGILSSIMIVAMIVLYFILGVG